MNKRLFSMAFAALIAASMLAAACSSDGDAGTDSADGNEATASAGDVASGEELYGSSCAGCHGKELEGGTGLALVDSSLVKDSSEADLAAFIEAGRDSSDPDNQTGVAMPPKGGNPSLSDQDLADLAAFLKSKN